MIVNFQEETEVSLQTMYEAWPTSVQNYVNLTINALKDAQSDDIESIAENMGDFSLSIPDALKADVLHCILLGSAGFRFDRSELILNMLQYMYDNHDGLGISVADIDRISKNLLKCTLGSFVQHGDAEDDPEFVFIGNDIFLTNILRIVDYQIEPKWYQNYFKVLIVITDDIANYRYGSSAERSNLINVHLKTVLNILKTASIDVVQDYHEKMVTFALVAYKYSKVNVNNEIAEIVLNILELLASKNLAVGLELESNIERTLIYFISLTSEVDANKERVVNTLVNAAEHSRGFLLNLLKIKSNLAKPYLEGNCHNIKRTILESREKVIIKCPYNEWLWDTILKRLTQNKELIIDLIEIACDIPDAKLLTEVMSIIKQNEGSLELFLQRNNISSKTLHKIFETRTFNPYLLDKPILENYFELIIQLIQHNADLLITYLDQVMVLCSTISFKLPERKKQMTEFLENTVLNVLKMFADGKASYDKDYNGTMFLDLVLDVYSDADANLKDSIIANIGVITKNSPAFMISLLSSMSSTVEHSKKDYGGIIKTLLVNVNINELRTRIFERNEFSLLRSIIMAIQSSGDAAALESFITDLPSFGPIRVILGYLSTIEDFRADPLWTVLEETFSSDSGKKLLEQFTAEAIVGWQHGNPVNFEVMSAASRLFNLDDKIKNNAVKDKKFNPLLLSIESHGYLDHSANGLMAHYIQDPDDFAYLSQLNATDKLLVLGEILTYDEHFNYLNNYDLFLENFITNDVMVKIDGSLISHVLQHRYELGVAPVPKSLATILEWLGYVFPDNFYDIDSFVAYVKEPSDYVGSKDPFANPIRSMLVGELQVDFLMPQEMTKIGLQSAHDEALEGLFDEFATSRANELMANQLQDAAAQINYIRLFTLFDFYRTNPDAKVFKELLKVHLIRALFENNKDFSQFYKKYSKLHHEQTAPSGLLYAITGKTDGISTSKREIIDQSMTEHQEDDYALKALISWRTLRGVEGQEVQSNFLTTSTLRTGTVALISYIYSSSKNLSKFVKSHEDVLNILYRLPRDSDSGAALLQIYRNHKDLPFAYSQYQSTLDRIFSERMQQNRGNISQYIAESITAYGENSQSCVRGCKARMFTLLLGDMLYGPKRSRLREIQDYIYEAMLAKLNEKIELAANNDDILKILSSFLSTNKYNASLYAVGKENEMSTSYYIDKEPTILPLTELFAVENLEAFGKQFIDGFNNNGNYNIDGNHALNLDEALVMQVLLRIGGGEAVLKRLNEQFAKYVPKNQALNKIEAIIRHIRGLAKSNDGADISTLTAMQMQIQKGKMKDIAQRIFDLQNPGKIYDPEKPESSPEYQKVVELIALAKANPQDPEKLAVAVEKLAPQIKTQSKSHRGPSKPPVGG